MRRAGSIAATALVSAMAIAAALAVEEPPYASPVSGELAAGEAYGVEVAPLSEALTFARYRDGERLRLLRVESYREGLVRGVRLDALTGTDIQADPIALLGHADHARIAEAEGERVAVPDSLLDLPFEGTRAQIAVGGNYPLHKDETALEESFLFPKMREPGRFDAVVPVGGGLLDYEIELGFVPLPPRGGGAPAMGLVLATDYTDRAILLERVSLRDIASGLGFTDAKSRRGAMPVGNLFVVPRDADRFYRSLELRFYVNGQLRQVAPPGTMVWDMREIVRQSLGAADRRWPWDGGLARLPVENGAIVPRTIILSGTTDGVVFRPPSGRQLALGGLEAVFRPWQAREALVAPAIREAKRDRRYLQPGDEVVGAARFLGVVRNRIVP